MIDSLHLRSQFPALSRHYGGRPVIFADNAATSLKPLCVMKAVEHYYTHICSNVHRGVNVLAQEADDLYEDARRDIAALINAGEDEIVFVRNATEGINLAARIIGLKKSDAVVCSLAEHHSNYLPWLVAASVAVVKPGDDGRVTAAAFDAAAGPATKLFAIGHVSNVTGIIAPVAEIIVAAKKRGAMSLVDAAQSVSHMPVDVKAIGCDFMAFSGHKMMGPSGIGALYVRRELLEDAPPMLLGGGMVEKVELGAFMTAPGARRYEAGTPNIEGTMGMGVAARFLSSLGMSNVLQHELALADELVGGLSKVSGLKLLPATQGADRLPVVSFVVPGTDENDIAAMLCNRFGIMVRSGVHCAEPLIRSLGVKGTVRVSLALYNTMDEAREIVRAVGSLCASLRRA